MIPNWLSRVIFFKQSQTLCFSEIIEESDDKLFSLDGGKTHTKTPISFFLMF